MSIAEQDADPGDTTWHVATAYGLWRALFSRLDRVALEREVLRGDLDAFARAAFLTAAASTSPQPWSTGPGGRPTVSRRSERWTATSRAGFGPRIVSHEVATA